MGEAAAAIDAEAKAHELRRHERLELVSRELPGPLTRTDGSGVFAVAMDVSQGGLGIATNEPLGIGTELDLTPEGGAPIHLRVVWQKEKRKNGHILYRHGLLLVDAGADLVGAFFAAGGLDYLLDEPDFDLP